MLTRIPGIVAALLMASAAFSLSYAQISIDPFGMGSYFRGLTDEDRTLIRNASSSLYQNREAKAGQFETWENPDSGNHGTVTLVKQFQAKQMPCWRLRHSIKIVGQKDLKTIEISRCKAPSGEWKIL
jgi:surface antigen